MNRTGAVAIAFGCLLFMCGCAGVLFAGRLNAGGYTLLSVLIASLFIMLAAFKTIHGAIERSEQEKRDREFFSRSWRR